MKTVRFLSFLLVLSQMVGTVRAQSVPFTPPNNDNPPYQPPTNTPPHVVEVQQPDQAAPHSLPGSGETDPAKIADFEARFKKGTELARQGDLAGARKIFDGILADDPNARGSLFEAGQISIQLGDLDKANDYLSKLHDLEPNFPQAIELLIQVNQALKHDVKVELLCREFQMLHDGGKNPKLAQSLCFVRERFPQNKDEVVVSQFFDYTKDPNTVWMAEVFGADNSIKRRILLNYDPDATKGLRAQDAKFASTKIFTWMEHVLKDGKVTKINAYVQIFALPEYQKFRSAMLAILANPPPPIYSAPIDASQQ
jgi:tetratricopeptide (TPR) repeat protein